MRPLRKHPSANESPKAAPASGLPGAPQQAPLLSLQAGEDVEIEDECKGFSLELSVTSTLTRFSYVYTSKPLTVRGGNHPGRVPLPLLDSAILLHRSRIVRPDGVSLTPTDAIFRFAATLEPEELAICAETTAGAGAMGSRQQPTSASVSRSHQSAADSANLRQDASDEGKASSQNSSRGNGSVQQHKELVTVLEKAALIGVHTYTWQTAVRTVRLYAPFLMVNRHPTPLLLSIPRHPPQRLDPADWRLLSPNILGVSSNGTAVTSAGAKKAVYFGVAPPNLLKELLEVVSHRELVQNTRVDEAPTNGRANSRERTKTTRATFRIDTVGRSGQVVVPRGIAMGARNSPSDQKQHWLGVTVSVAPPPFLRTKIVNVYSRFTLVNSLGVDMWIKETNDADGEVIHLSPGQQATFHPQGVGPSGTPALQFSLFPPGSEDEEEASFTRRLEGQPACPGPIEKRTLSDSFAPRTLPAEDSRSFGGRHARTSAPRQQWSSEIRIGTVLSCQMRVLDPVPPYATSTRWSSSSAMPASLSPGGPRRQRGAARGRGRSYTIVQVEVRSVESAALFVCFERVTKAEFLLVNASRRLVYFSQVLGGGIMQSISGNRAMRDLLLPGDQCEYAWQDPLRARKRLRFTVVDKGGQQFHCSCDISRVKQHPPLALAGGKNVVFFSTEVFRGRRVVLITDNYASTTSSSALAEWASGLLGAGIVAGREVRAAALGSAWKRLHRSFKRRASLPDEELHVSGKRGERRKGVHSLSLTGQELWDWSSESQHGRRWGARDARKATETKASTRYDQAARTTYPYVRRSISAGQIRGLSLPRSLAGGSVNSALRGSTGGSRTSAGGAKNPSGGIVTGRHEVEGASAEAGSRHSWTAAPVRSQSAMNLGDKPGRREFGKLLGTSADASTSRHIASQDQKLRSERKNSDKGCQDFLDLASAPNTEEPAAYNRVPLKRAGSLDFLSRSQNASLASRSGPKRLARSWSHEDRFSRLLSSGIHTIKNSVWERGGERGRSSNVKREKAVWLGDEEITSPEVTEENGQYKNKSTKLASTGNNHSAANTRVPERSRTASEVVIPRRKSGITVRYNVAPLQGRVQIARRRLRQRRLAKGGSDLYREGDSLFEEEDEDGDSAVLHPQQASAVAQGSDVSGKTTAGEAYTAPKFSELQIYLTLHLEGCGFSLVDSLPQELAYIAISGVEAAARRTRQLHTETGEPAKGMVMDYKLSVRNFQVDNGVPGAWSSTILRLATAEERLRHWGADDKRGMTPGEGLVSSTKVNTVITSSLAPYIVWDAEEARNKRSEGLFFRVQFGGRWGEEATILKYFDCALAPLSIHVELDTAFELVRYLLR
ncbi:agap005082- related [Cystoisospora suis]|uniref:Agap005082-related n=1 Tax=Cystoisospora suis TaxID=483139 RepID=A0A2C6KX87_9APIC|nr:agap005082- related [Cystoisospora suis]